MGGANVVIIVRYLIGPYLLIGLVVWFNYFVAIYSSVHVTVYSVVESSSVAEVFQLIKAYKRVEVLCSTRTEDSSIGIPAGRLRRIM